MLDLIRMLLAMALLVVGVLTVMIVHPLPGILLIFTSGLFAWLHELRE